ncbi:MAG: tRNA (adenosine(37)-N6)-threonylcarbamoyltransferase complex transferase subunit TsaD [Acidobacteriota bacterium]|nr:tRNA (adenosine(37)-N6)-threonylcarbamoyltransferase complex transferase subunit TsaD [Acidobacteriota bacterium]
MSTLTSPVVLGIETSCDDTACAVVGGDGTVLSSVVSSQLAAHRPFGGVVPEIASREHLANWPAVSREALDRGGVSLEDIDVVAATHGPGLMGALLVGLSLGKAMAYGLGKPFHAVHHLEGHLFSPFLSPPGEPAAKPPDSFAGLVVSGGHTSIYLVEGEKTRVVAETRDDAMGEVFDKIGKRLGLVYPQGPRVDELAEKGAPGGKRFAIARCSDGSLDFSYSGLKTQVLVEIERLEKNGVETRIAQEPEPRMASLLAAFRLAAVDQLIDRLDRVYADSPFSCLAISGGVAANRLLRRRFPDWSAARGVDLRLVPLIYSGDNAAMIAHAALRRERRGRSDDPLKAEASSRLAMPTS